MTRNRKKGGVVSPSTREGHHAAHDAPDNPLSIPRGPSPTTLEAPGWNPGETIEPRRSGQIRPTDSTTLDAGDEPVYSSTNHELAEKGDRESDHDRRSAQDDDSRLHGSALTPLEEAGGLRSPIRSPNRRPRAESSLAGEDRLGSDLGERRRRGLRQLERDACIANDRLQRARKELEDERSRSPRNSKSTSSPEAEKDNLQHHSASDENIRQAIRDLCTPTHRDGETRDEYDHRLVASSRLRLEQAKKEDTARKQLREQEKLRVEAESLLLEIREAEDRNHHRKVGDNEDRRESTRVREEAHQNY